MSSTVEVAAEHAAVERGKMPASEEKTPAVEKDKNSTEGGSIGMNLEGKEQPEIDPEAEKSCNDEKTKEPIDAEEPSSEGGSAMINKGQILLSKAEKTQTLNQPIKMLRRKNTWCSTKQASARKKAGLARAQQGRAQEGRAHPPQARRRAARRLLRPLQPGIRAQRRSPFELKKHQKQHSYSEQGCHLEEISCSS